MRRLLTVLVLQSIATAGIIAREITDTVYTLRNDRIILTYKVETDGDRISVSIPSAPRIIPSEALRRSCKGNLSKLKAVVFSRVGEYENVKWKGMTPTAFTVPSGLRYDRSSSDGYYILGECAPISFTRKSTGREEIRFPVYVAVYEKKQTYRIEGSGTQPLTVKVGETATKNGGQGTAGAPERITVRSSVETEGDNADAILALGSIRMVMELLATETGLPFSQTLTMEISNLRSIKDRVRDEEVIAKINETLMAFNAKERELKEAEREAALSEQTRQQALLAQQKQEEEDRRQAEEEKARIQEEKQQKRTVWMVAGGILLAVLAFIGNAVFKHFRDLRNQKNIMEMQNSLAKQAEHEAGRRSREIVRNRIHKIANDGKGRVRKAVENNNKPKTKRKSI